MTEIEKEIEDEYVVIIKLSKLLTDTANALKGEPDGLTLHSWHDLPEVAEKLIEALKPFAEIGEELETYTGNLPEKLVELNVRAEMCRNALKVLRDIQGDKDDTV